MLGRVALVERRIAINVRAKEINGEELSEAQLSEYYEQRVDAGLFTLQQCDLTLALAARLSQCARSLAASRC